MKLKKIDEAFWRPASWVGRAGATALGPFAARPRSDTLIVRPGGMGDLILLTLAAEEMGLDPRGFDWLIEKRSELWAKRLGLGYLAYDRNPLGTHLSIAGRYARVINTEQRFGLSQATALLARARGGTLTGFSTNRAAATSDRVVSYDPYLAHESVEFSRILAEGTGKGRALGRDPRRARIRPAGRGRAVALGGLQAPSRALGLQHWEALIREWAGAEAGRVTLVAGPADETFAQELSRLLKGSEVVIGRDFGRVCDLLAVSSEVFTIDGGLLHVASYYGVPVTAIFTSSREMKWAPLAPGSSLVRTTGLACQPCALFAQVPPCPNAYACKAVELPRDRKPIAEK